MRKPPVFLIGANRSGTSILATILAEHEEINPIFSVQKPKLGDGGHTRAYSESTIWDSLENNNARLWGLNENINNVYINNLPEKRINQLKKELNNLRSENKLDLIKKPKNIMRIPLIKKMYPKSKFILIVRNLKNYIHGGKTKFKVGEDKIKEHWHNVYDIGLRDLKEYAENTHIIIC